MPNDGLQLYQELRVGFHVPPPPREQCRGGECPATPASGNQPFWEHMGRGEGTVAAFRVTQALHGTETLSRGVSIPFPVLISNH